MDAVRRTCTADVMGMVLWDDARCSGTSWSGGRAYASMPTESLARSRLPRSPPFLRRVRFEELAIMRLLGRNDKRVGLGGEAWLVGVHMA